jgi:hypothetical protein
VIPDAVINGVNKGEILGKGNVETKEAWVSYGWREYSFKDCEKCSVLCRRSLDKYSDYKHE